MSQSTTQPNQSPDPKKTSWPNTANPQQTDAEKKAAGDKARASSQDSCSTNKDEPDYNSSAK